MHIVTNIITEETIVNMTTPPRPSGCAEDPSDRTSRIVPRRDVVLGVDVAPAPGRITIYHPVSRTYEVRELPTRVPAQHHLGGHAIDFARGFGMVPAGETPPEKDEHVRPGADQTPEACGMPAPAGPLAARACELEYGHDGDHSSTLRGSLSMQRTWPAVDDPSLDFAHRAAGHEIDGIPRHAPGCRLDPDHAGRCGPRWVTVDLAEADDVAADQHRLAHEHGDDGVTAPDPDTVDAILRCGVSDRTQLGRDVIYHTDARGSVGSYQLPAKVVTTVQSHANLPALRAMEERGLIRQEQRNDGSIWWYTTVTAESEGWYANEGGLFVPSNPVPVPTPGTVHLVVFTPGVWQHQGMQTYTELSVPYSPDGGARTWRYPSDDPIPF